MKFIESLEGKIPEGLLVTTEKETNVGLVKSLRLLSGTATVQYPGRSATPIRHFSPDPSFRGRAKPKIKRVAQMIGEGLEISEVAELCGRSRGRNRVFYETFSSELSYVLYYMEKKQYIAAFIYYYRCIEAAAFAFPLVYAIKTRDFKSSYDNISKFFANKPDVGELGFFKSFVNSLEMKELRETTYILDLSYMTSEEIEGFETKISTILPKSTVSKGRISIDKSTGELTCMFSYFIDLVTSYRNAFVHLQSGTKRNFISSELVDNELFCGQLVSQGLQFLSVVFIICAEAAHSDLLG